AVDVERDVGARQLAIELLRELGGAGAQAVAQAIALGVAHLAEPPVLQRAEHAEQRQQRRGDHQLPDRLPHNLTLREFLWKTARFTFLTNRLPTPNNLPPAFSSYSTSVARLKPSRSDAHAVRGQSGMEREASAERNTREVRQCNGRSRDSHRSRWHSAASR